MRTTRRLQGAAGLALALGVLGGCAAQSADDFWSAARIVGAAEAEMLAPLDRMAATADAVVIGTFGEVLGTRPILDIEVLQVELRIDEVVAGDPRSDVVVMEFLLLDMTDHEDIVLPEGQMLVLLLEKISDVDPPNVWRVTNSLGLWTVNERGELDTPLSEEPPLDMEEYGFPDLVAHNETVHDLIDDL